MIAALLWRSPQPIKALAARFGVVPVRDDYVDAPTEYRLARWDEDHLDAHGGSWRHRWSTYTRKARV